MAGLQKLCKLYGSIKINGVKWVYDYENDKPVKASEIKKSNKK